MSNGFEGEQKMPEQPSNNSTQESEKEDLYSTTEGMQELLDTYMETPYHDVMPGKEGTSEGNDSVYDTAVPVAWAMRLADTNMERYSDPKFLDIAKEKLDADPDRRFYIAYMLLTEAHELESDYMDTLGKLDPVSDKLKDFVVDSLVDGFTDDMSIEKLSMIGNIYQRMKVKDTWLEKEDFKKVMDKVKELGVIDRLKQSAELSSNPSVLQHVMWMIESAEENIE